MPTLNALHYIKLISHKREHLLSLASRLARTTFSLRYLRIRVSNALVTIYIIFVTMAAVRERRVPKQYSDEVFPTGLLFRKKTRTKTNDRKLYPVVVTAVNKITKRVKFTKLAGIFGIF